MIREDANEKLAKLHGMTVNRMFITDGIDGEDLVLI